MQVVADFRPANVGGVVSRFARAGGLANNSSAAISNSSEPAIVSDDGRPSLDTILGALIRPSSFEACNECLPRQPDATPARARRDARGRHRANLVETAGIEPASAIA